MMDFFNGKRVLVTGATGLIGKTLVKRLLLCDGCNVVAVVRDLDRAREIFGDRFNCIEFIKSDICELKPEDINVDYVVHSAAVTESRRFVYEPVEVINTTYEGTKRALEFARMNPVQSFVYLSTMEIYGTIKTEQPIAENHGCEIDTMKVRSSYPESKRLGEALCMSYCAEYGVPVRVLRLAQTFGKGVLYNDHRVFAEFARCVIEGRDIVLHTKGDTKRSYLDVEDACEAILVVLSKGYNGEAYNVANESTYCSIAEMADYVSTEYANGRIKVRIEEDNDVVKKYGYADTLYMNLSCEKIRQLGWVPKSGMKKMYDNMIEGMMETYDKQ